MRASFGGLGHGFTPHRHDTNGIAVTDYGVQAFDYPGSLERSLPGQTTVLHPDELHDGRELQDSGEGGFAYRIVDVTPADIGAAVPAITGRPTPLPFVREPVAVSPRLAAAVGDAFGNGLDPLARDSLIVPVAEGLLAADSSLAHPAAPRGPDLAALGRAREFLDVPPSSVLESVTGLTRYELTREFVSCMAPVPTAIQSCDAWTAPARRC